MPSYTLLSPVSEAGPATAKLSQALETRPQHRPQKRPEKNAIPTVTHCKRRVPNHAQIIITVRE